MNNQINIFSRHLIYQRENTKPATQYTIAFKLYFILIFSFD